MDEQTATLYLAVMKILTHLGATAATDRQMYRWHDEITKLDRAFRAAEESANNLQRKPEGGD